MDGHLWFKSKRPTADSDEDVRRLWYDKKPTLYTSRTGCDAPHQRGHGYEERVGAGIGKFVGMVATPERRAMEAAANSRDYKCQQCGCNYEMSNLKRNMDSHLSHKANKACLDHYSESTDKREMEWVRLAHID